METKTKVAELLFDKYKQDKDILEGAALYLDSLDKVEVAMWAEKEYGIEIYDEELFSWTVLSDIVNCIESKIKKS